MPWAARDGHLRRGTGRPDSGSQDTIPPSAPVSQQTSNLTRDASFQADARGPSFHSAISLFRRAVWRFLSRSGVQSPLLSTCTVSANVATPLGPPKYFSFFLPKASRAASGFFVLLSRTRLVRPLRALGWGELLAPR